MKINPDWRYSPPRSGKAWVDPCDHSKGLVVVVEIDATQITMLAQHYRHAGLPLPDEPLPRTRPKRNMK